MERAKVVIPNSEYSKKISYCPTKEIKKQEERIVPFTISKKN